MSRPTFTNTTSPSTSTQPRRPGVFRPQGATEAPVEKELSETSGVAESFANPSTAAPESLSASSSPAPSAPQAQPNPARPVFRRPGSSVFGAPSRPAPTPPQASQAAPVASSSPAVPTAPVSEPLAEASAVPVSPGRPRPAAAPPASGRPVRAGVFAPRGSVNAPNLPQEREEEKTDSVAASHESPFQAHGSNQESQAQSDSPKPAPAGRPRLPGVGPGAATPALKAQGRNLFSPKAVGEAPDMDGEREMGVAPSYAARPFDRQERPGAANPMGYQAAQTVSRRSDGLPLLVERKIEEICRLRGLNADQIEQKKQEVLRGLPRSIEKVNEAWLREVKSTRESYAQNMQEAKAKSQGRGVFLKVNGPDRVFQSFDLNEGKVPAWMHGAEMHRVSSVSTPFKDPALMFGKSAKHQVLNDSFEESTPSRSIKP